MGIISTQIQNQIIILKSKAVVCFWFSSISSTRLTKALYGWCLAHNYKEGIRACGMRGCRPPVFINMELSVLIPKVNKDGKNINRKDRYG